jgi:Na+-transporting methylmalonyl-CoA/oxaloacetate decarboxylase gamma subunit
MHDNDNAGTEEETTMRNLWQRLGAISGVVAAALIIAGTIFSDINPLVSPHDPSDAIASTFQQERSNLLLGSYLTMLGVFVFLWFLAYLRSHLSNTSERHWLANVAFGGGLISGAMILLATHFKQAFTVVSNFQGENQAAKALYILEWNERLLVEAPPLAALVGATAITGFIFRSFPWWISGLGILATGLLLSPSVSGLGVILAFLWIALVSVYLAVVAGRVSPESVSATSGGHDG